MGNTDTHTTPFFRKCTPFIIRLGALFVFLIAVSVMVGWFTKDKALIQIFPDFAPMQFNTALCFALASLALFTRTLNWVVIAAVLSLFVMAISGASMAQYLLSANYGIDQYFVMDFIHTKTTHAGRMSPLTSVCFLLLSLAIFPKRRHWALSIGFTVSVILIALASLITAPLDLEGVLGWGNLQRMALHTASSFLLLGGLLLCFILSNKAQENADYWQAIPTTTFIIALIMTTITWYATHETTTERNKAHFNALVQDTGHALHERFMLYEHALISGLGVFYASEFVSGDEWHAYISALSIDETLPGISGIGYIDYVREENLDEYIATTRENYRKDFKNHPDTKFSDKLIIKYIEPISRNIQAVGLDIGFEAKRRAAAEAARDTGKPTLTHRIELVQDSKKMSGFLLLVPVYNTKNTPPTAKERHEALLGWVYAPFMGPNFFNGLEATNKNQIDFDVFDSSTTDEAELIYSYNDADHPPSMMLKAAHIKTTHIEIAGKRWTIRWHTNDRFYPPADLNFAAIVAISGILFSLLLYVLLDTVIYSRARTAEEVKSRTKELADAVKFLSLIGENIPDMLIVKDDQFRIVLANQEFLNAYPEDMQDQIIGTTTLEKYSAEEAEKFLAHDKEALEHGYTENEETITFPNGTRRTLLTKKTRFENEDGEKFILAIARDITDQKIAAQQIIDTNTELSRSNTELERFAYIASHDLQEPLRKISGFTTLIAGKLKDQMDDDTQKYMDFIQDGVQRMHGLIQGLLEYSRINTEQLKTAKLDTNEIVTLATENLSELIKETNTKVKFKGLPNVYHDKVLLTQLFQNLISNAIKYKSDKAPIVTIKAEKNNEFWEFSVKDNGMGMDEKHFDKIFEMFQRLHRKEEIAGTGIGLSLCKKIVGRYKGKMWLQSKVGKGSTFYFTIPTKKTDQ